MICKTPLIATAAMLILLAPLAESESRTNLSGIIYYLDSQSGSDNNIGTEPGKAWKSLEKINSQVFQPGDKIYLKAGSRYTGQLKPQGSGSSKAPITVGMFGEGGKPRIDGQGLVLDTLLIRNVEFWEIENLEITNQGDNRQPWQTGVHIVCDGFGAMRHIRLNNLYVHDVNGDLRKSHEGCGIFFESRGRNNSHFDDLAIENCRVVRTDRNGICQRGAGPARSVHVVIRGNLLEDIGGDGIKLWGSNAGLIERNVVSGGRTRCKDAAAGIWPFNCDDTIIQFNEVSGMKGIIDGQGFDSDYLCRRSLFQYNYSHDNDGGFMLICSPGNSYNEGTVIRYNISQNDGINSARVFQIGGNPKNTLIYNNTIYIGPMQDLPLLFFNEWDGGNASETYFYNNIFYVDGKARYEWGKSTGNVFDKNVFFGEHKELPSDPHAVTIQPPLDKPGSGGNGIASLKGYILKPASDFQKGRAVPEHGGRDFFGISVPKDTPPCIGASESGK